MPITPGETQGVAADGRDLNDPHLSPTHDGPRQHLESPLRRPLDLLGRAAVGAGARRAQIVKRILALVAIPPANDKTTLRLVKMVIYRIRFVPHLTPPKHSSRLGLSVPLNRATDKIMTCRIDNGLRIML